MPALGAIEPGSAAIPRSFLHGTSNTFVFATKYSICGEGGSGYAADPTSPWAAFFGQNAAETTAHPSDPRATFQLAPGKGECLTSPLMAQSFTRAGILLACADGSVRLARPPLRVEIWNMAVQPNDLP